MPRRSKKPTQQAVSNIGGIIAPVKGWTSQKSLAEAEDGTALILDNIFPEAEAVRSRRGATLQASGIGSSVDSVLAYPSKTSAGKLFAAKSTSIYDVSGIGAVGAAVVTGKTNGKWQSELFANAADQFLVICNGVDGVMTYDGTTWVDQTASLTGFSALTFIQVCAHNSRLWFVPDNSTDLYYLPPSSINGALLKFGIGAQMRLGGKIIALSTWSSAQGNAMEDRLVIITNQGEVFIYAGTDPSSATTWSLSIRFVLSPPMSNRCFFPIGADLAILTEAGLIPLSQVIEIDSAVLSDKAFSKRIRAAYNESVKAARNIFGWCITTLPNSNMAIVNVPAAGGSVVQQFVMNTVTGAWCRFFGWNANCWAYLAGAIYYGDPNGNVLRAEYGANDNGSPIQLALLTSFSALNFPGRLKMVNLVRPIISSDTDQTASLAVAVDYIEPTLSPLTASAVSGSWFVWGTSVWGSSDIWRDEMIILGWDGAGNCGTMIAIAFSLSIDASAAGNEFDYRLIAFNIVFELGFVV